MWKGVLKCLVYMHEFDGSGHRFFLVVEDSILHLLNEAVNLIAKSHNECLGLPATLTGLHPDVANVIVPKHYVRK